MVKFVGFGFANDIDLTATNPTNMRSPQCILQQLQQTLEMWEMGL